MSGISCDGEEPKQCTNGDLHGAGSNKAKVIWRSKYFLDEHESYHADEHTCNVKYADSSCRRFVEDVIIHDNFNLFGKDINCPDSTSFLRR